MSILPVIFGGSTTPFRASFPKAAQQRADALALPILAFVI
jgi:hypothetical protein